MIGQVFHTSSIYYFTQIKFNFSIFNYIDVRCFSVSFKAFKIYVR